MFKAFLGSQDIKNECLKNIKIKKDNGELRQGIFDNGTILDGNEYTQYEDKLGIPMSLAYTFDTIFHFIPREIALDWPERFVNSIPVGIDLSNIHHEFMIWLIRDSGFLSYPEKGDLKNLVDYAVEILKNPDSITNVKARDLKNRAHNLFMESGMFSYYTIRCIRHLALSLIYDDTYYMERELANAIDKAIMSACEKNKTIDLDRNRAALYIRLSDKLEEIIAGSMKELTE